jgi:MoaA/NifB/PqqE/SkfB family radical SAM enzyme
MSTGDFLNILNKTTRAFGDQIKDVTISGFGEAFIDPEILLKIEIARNLGFKVHVLTNGSLLSKENIDRLFKLKVNDIRISLHTTDVNNYIGITSANEKQFNKVINNLEYCISKRNGKTKIIITADIIEENKNDVDELIEKYSERVDVLDIWSPHNWVNWGNYREDKEKIKTCGRPFSGPIQVQVDSTVNMCCFDYNGELLLGDARRKYFEDIFNSKAYHDLCWAHKSGRLEDYICNNCDQRNKDKSDALIYCSKFSKQDRIKKTSTNYRDLKAK